LQYVGREDQLQDLYQRLATSRRAKPLSNLVH